MKSIKELISKMKEWCGYDAFERGYDKPTDEHSCDNSRGQNSPADELLAYAESLLPDMPEIGDRERIKIDRPETPMELFIKDLKLNNNTIITHNLRPPITNELTIFFDMRWHGMDGAWKSLKEAFEATREVLTPPTSTSDMPEEKPDGFVAWHPDGVYWMDGLPDREYPQMFGSKREAEEYLCECSVLLVEGWQIRPVKLQFMDGK